VWSGDSQAGPLLVDNEHEVFGQRLAADGTEIANDFRISDMGPNGDVNFGAFGPDVAYNTLANDYAVVWSGDDDIPPLVDEDIEIFLQRLDADGTPKGINDQRISTTGLPGDTTYFADSPAIAFSEDFSHDYLIVWSAFDEAQGGGQEGREIYGQRFSDGGFFIGGEIRISSMGPDLDTTYNALNPAVAYSSADQEYLVIWEGDDDRGDLFNEEFEVFGQLLSRIGSEVGIDDVRLSDLGPDGHPGFTATFPAIAYAGASNVFGLAWHGQDDIPPLVVAETEIFFQRFKGGIFGDGFETGDTSAWSSTVQ
jgi:hypothetical protein